MCPLVCRFLDWALDARGYQEYTTLLTLMNMVVQLSRKYCGKVLFYFYFEVRCWVEHTNDHVAFVWLLNFHVQFTVPRPHSSHWGLWELLSFLIKWEISKHGNWVNIWIKINAVKHKKWYDQSTYASKVARMWWLVHSICNTF